MGLPEPRPGPRTHSGRSSKSYQKSTLISDRFLEPKLGQKGAKLGAKILPKSIQNLIDFLIDFWMRFWSQNGSQNGSQNHQKSFKNHSRTESGLKNVIFSKLAPRLHENTIFEVSGTSKFSKIDQKRSRNHSKIRLKFWSNFDTIFKNSCYGSGVSGGGQGGPNYHRT